MDTPAQPDRFDTRLTQIEESLAHLQRAVEELGEVLVRVQRRLDTLEGDLLHLAQRVTITNRAPAENRSLEDDRPPHY